MPSSQIQWFPGHMAKTRRMLKECLPLVDIILELSDARIPYSSQNPELRKLAENKPVLKLLTKSSLADPDATALWKRSFEDAGSSALFIDCISGQGISDIAPAVRELLADKAERYEDRGMKGRSFKAMIVGIPNVGKSTLINRLSGVKKAKAEDRPGVTVDKAWYPTGAGLNLLDTPGVLWSKFEDVRVGENLAMTGAIKDQILNYEDIAVLLCGRLRRLYPKLLCTRYKLESIPEELSDGELFELIGRKRGFLLPGNEVNYERTAVMLLDEFRGGKIGRITLERPEKASH